MKSIFILAAGFFICFLTIAILLVDLSNERSTSPPPPTVTVTTPMPMPIEDPEIYLK